MKISKIISVVSTVLIIISSLSVPALATTENSLPSSSYSSNNVISSAQWSQYLRIAKKYGCTFNVNPSQRAAFCQRVSLSEFEESIREQKSKIVTTNSAITQITTADKGALKTSAGVTLAATTAAKTTQKIWSGSSALGPLTYLTVNITATYYNASNTFKSCDAVNSSITGFTLGFAYTQTSYSANISSTKKTLTVVVYGTMSEVLICEGIGTICSWQVYRTFTSSL